MLPKSVERRPFLSPRTPQKIPPKSIPTIWELRSRNVAETCASPCAMPRSVRLGCRTMGKRSRSNMSTKYPRAATKTVRLRTCGRRGFSNGKIDTRITTLDQINALVKSKDGHRKRHAAGSQPAHARVEEGQNDRARVVVRHRKDGRTGGQALLRTSKDPRM